jgi:REP element-mobilizing transposase RayT
MSDRPSPTRAKVDATSRRVISSQTGGDDGYTFFNAFDPCEPIGKLSGNLPHWRQEGVTYFVTFRTADSLPKEKVQQWILEREQWLRKNPEPHSNEQRYEYWQLFPARLQYWLDQSHGACVLGDPNLQRIVEQALQYFDGERYALRDEVVMPNHVHVIVTPIAEHLLSSIVQSWKSFTAHEINKRLHRQGAFWQKEAFDHIVRNTEPLQKFRDYIEGNRQCRRDFQSRVL